MDDAFIPIVGVVFFHFLSLPVDFFFQKLKLACPLPAIDNLLITMTTTLDQNDKILRII